MEVPKATASAPQQGAQQGGLVRGGAKNEARLILQGTQEGMGWSMVIMESTGKMTLTASGGEVGFVVFGACTPK